MAHIIYLDDEEALTDIFSLFFENTEHHVVTFTDEEAAITYCEQHSPHIAFIDYRLSSMRGDEVAVKLPDSIKKVLVTGDVIVENDFLFNAILKKPFKLAELLSTVTTLS